MGIFLLVFYRNILQNISTLKVKHSLPYVNIGFTTAPVGYFQHGSSGQKFEWRHLDTVVMASLLYLGQLAFFLVLSLTWVIFFAAPALTRFLGDGVTVEESTEESSSLPPPAITLCPMEGFLNGWKNLSGPNWESNWSAHCPDAASTDDFVACLEAKTRNLTEILPSEVTPYDLGATRSLGPPYPPPSLMDPDLWVTEVTAALQGRCYTLNYTEPLKTDPSVDGLLFNFDPALTYYAFIHQPGFFLFSFNPLSLPDINLLLEESSVGMAYHYLYIQVVCWYGGMAYHYLYLQVVWWYGSMVVW